MKCSICAYKKNSRSSIYKYYCSLNRVHCLDDYCGCSDGVEINTKPNTKPEEIKCRQCISFSNYTRRVTPKKENKYISQETKSAEK